MLRKGYIEIQIEMLGTMLAKIVSLMLGKDYRGASQAIRQASQQTTGLDISLLAALTDESLLDQFTDQSGLDAGSCFVIGCLMQEQAAICRLTDQPERAEMFSRKALYLQIVAMLHEPRLRAPEHAQRIETLLSLTAYQDLSASEQEPLYRYHELEGRYALAEDILYMMREQGYPEWEEEARAFYERLLACSDEALTTGGLSREEVEEALEELSE